MKLPKGCEWPDPPAPDVINEKPQGPPNVVFTDGVVGKIIIESVIATVIFSVFVFGMVYLGFI